LAIHRDFFAFPQFRENSLACAGHRSDECHHRGITAQGESNMTNSITEEQGTTPAAETAQAPKPPKKARVSARAAHVAPSKAKSVKKASPAKKAPKGHKKAETARAGSKKAEILALLQRPKGATLAEIMKVTGWQAHSVRGFISGILGKKLGLAVESAKREDGERVYSISR
jgi:hypothetical protein